MFIYVCSFARPVANYILEVAGTPYQWVAGTEIEVKKFFLILYLLWIRHRQVLELMD